MDGTTLGLGFLMTGALAGLFFLVFNVLLLVAAAFDARSRRFPNALAAAMAAVALLVAVLVAYRSALFDAGFLSAGVGVSSADAIGASADRALLLLTLKHLAASVAAAFAACAALIGFEVLWRRFRGVPGIGMGDVKLLFCLMLVSPSRGILAFAGGLALLAVSCMVLRKRDLPLIPFIAAAWLVMLVISFAVGAW